MRSIGGSVTGPRVGFVLAGTLVAIGLGFLVWGLWPATYHSQILEFSPDEGPANGGPTTGSTDGTPPATAASIRRVQSVALEYPNRIRLRDRAPIFMQVLLTPEANDSAAIPGTTPGAEPVRPVAGWIGGARLELLGASVVPPEEIDALIPEGGGVDFMWSVVPREAGELQGTAWFVFITPEDTSGELVRTAVSAQTLNVAATSLWGMSGEAARFAGSTALIAGLVAGLAAARNPRTPRRAPGASRD